MVSAFIRTRTISADCQRSNDRYRDSRISTGRCSHRFLFRFLLSPNSGGLWRRLRSNSRGWRRGWRRCGGCRPTSNATAPPSSKPPAKAASSPPKPNSPAKEGRTYETGDATPRPHPHRAPPEMAGPRQIQRTRRPDTANLPPLPEGWTWATVEQLSRDEPEPSQTPWIGLDSRRHKHYTRSVWSSSNLDEESVRLKTGTSDEIQRSGIYAR